MDDLLVFFAQNTLGALILALCVFGATRVWRNPTVVHVFWLLVLIKLIAPPVVGVDGKAVTRGVRSTAPVQTATNPPASQVVDDRVSAFGAAGELSPPRLLPQTFSNVDRAQQPVGPDSALVTPAERHAPDLASVWPRISHVLFWILARGSHVLRNGRHHPRCPVLQSTAVHAPRLGAIAIAWERNCSTVWRAATAGHPLCRNRRTASVLPWPPAGDPLADQPFSATGR